MIENRDKFQNISTPKRKFKRHHDHLYKLKVTIRSRIGSGIKRAGFKKDEKTEIIIGCSFMQAKTHLELLFKDGMNWGNHGKWHIDHIKPLALAETEEELIKLFHYTNLQPLWAKENLQKGASYSK